VENALADSSRRWSEHYHDNNKKWEACMEVSCENIPDVLHLTSDVGITAHGSRVEEGVRQRVPGFENGT
jgi:hypothetical protein